MRATGMDGTGELRRELVFAARLAGPNDAPIRATLASPCGSEHPDAPGDQGHSA